MHEEINGRSTREETNLIGDPERKATRSIYEMWRNDATRVVIETYFNGDAPSRQKAVARDSRY